MSSTTWRVTTARGSTQGESYSKTNARLAAKAVAHSGVAAVAEDVLTGEAYLYIPDDSRPFGWDEEGGPIEDGRPKGWWAERLSEKRKVVRRAPRFVVVCDGTQHRNVRQERGMARRWDQSKRVGPCPPTCPTKKAAQEPAKPSDGEAS